MVPNLIRLEQLLARNGFMGFPGVIPLSIASVDANNISNVLNFAFRGPIPETSFFFSQPAAGLTTNRVLVWDFRAGAPLRNFVFNHFWTYVFSEI